MLAINRRATRVCTRRGCLAPEHLGAGRRAVLYSFTTTGGGADSAVNQVKLHCSCGCPSLYWADHMLLCNGEAPPVWIKGKTENSSEREFAREPTDDDFTPPSSKSKKKTKSKLSAIKRKSNTGKVN